MLKLTDGKRNYIIKERMMGEKEIKNKAMLNFSFFQSEVIDIV